MNTPIETRSIIPVFTLFEERPGYISGRQTFVDIGDPTGYEWAIKYLGSWSHWLRLINTKWFKEALEVWQSELKVKTTAQALATIQKIAEEEGKSQFAASRYIANREWEKPTTGRGRPSKEEIDGELKRAIRHVEAEQEDLERIKLKVVK